METRTARSQHRRMEEFGKWSWDSGKNNVRTNWVRLILLNWLLLFFPAYFQLNNVYSKADRLNKWFKKVRIDSFSKGSVLVDYFVELSDVSRDINTQEIKQMFHNALTTVPISIVPLSNSSTSDEYGDDELENESGESQAKPLKVKESFLMGKFVLDPAATDFIGE